MNRKRKSWGLVPCLCCFTSFYWTSSQIVYDIRAQGSNPLLYQPGVEPIMHLDQATFADTVFDPTKTNAFLVEFYADWCGHCRAFAPFFREFANLVNNWRGVVQIAAVNCADNFNGQICRANGIGYFPMLKYFPRTSTNFGDAMLIEASHSGSNLRDQLAGKILNEFNHFQFLDWPNLRYIEVNGQTRFEDLWQGTLPSATFLVIVFEQFESVGAQMILDMYPFLGMLKINSFPYVAMFKRGDQQSIFMDHFCLQLFDSIHKGQMPSKKIMKEASGPTNVSASSRAGLQFPAGRLRRLLKKGNYADRVGAGASIYMAAVLEYLCAELLELAGNAARDNKKVRISPRHLQLAVRNDEELNKLLAHVTIAAGGVLPNINSVLLPKKTNESSVG
uniref:Thioredoxin domain-containing protein n=1 Tax=Ditylenchus dipsaci TaxID=166011 RepID=A0A915D3A1_9BILA